VIELKQLTLSEGCVNLLVTDLVEPYGLGSLEGFGNEMVLIHVDGPKNSGTKLTVAHRKGAALSSRPAASLDLQQLSGFLLLDNLELDGQNTIIEVDILHLQVV